MVATASLHSVMPQFPHPIGSQQEGTTYLVAEEDKNALRIRRSSKHGSELNNFWMVWARELLLKVAVRYELEIAIVNSNVRIASPLPLKKWYWPVHNLIANIVPLQPPPIRRFNVNDGPITWKVQNDIDIEEIFSKVDLPESVTRDYEIEYGWTRIFLIPRGVGRRNRVFPPREVAMMIEYQVTLVCNNGTPSITLAEQPQISTEFTGGERSKPIPQRLRPNSNFL